MRSGTLQKSHFPGPDFMQVVNGMLRKCEKKDLLMFVGIARQLWIRRNEVLHGGNFWQPGLLV